MGQQLFFRPLPWNGLSWLRCILQTTGLISHVHHKADQALKVQCLDTDPHWIQVLHGWRHVGQESRFRFLNLARNTPLASPKNDQLDWFRSREPARVQQGRLERRLFSCTRPSRWWSSNIAKHIDEAKILLESRQLKACVGVQIFQAQSGGASTESSTPNMRSVLACGSAKSWRPFYQSFCSRLPCRAHAPLSACQVCKCVEGASFLMIKCCNMLLNTAGWHAMKNTATTREPMGLTTQTAQAFDAMNACRSVLEAIWLLTHVWPCLGSKAKVVHFWMYTCHCIHAPQQYICW